MAQDTYNVIPVTLAVLLHVIVFGSLFVAFDLSPSAAPPMPLSIKATLVVEDTSQPPVVQEPVPPPEPEPEPEPVQPDPDEEDRNQAEEDKRVEDARIERERLANIERDRKEAERKAAEDKARREREAEAERERIRKELEAQRLRDIEQQRQDNRLEEERLLRQAQQALLDAEDAQFEAQNSTEAQVYQNMITQQVFRNWARPGTARDDLKCIVSVQQIPGGTVVSARVIECNGNDIVRRSVENAVYNASPLPQPSNPLLFLRTFQITFLKTSTIDD